MCQIINTCVCALIMMTGVYAFGKIILNKSINIKKRKLILLILIFTIIQTIIGENFVGTIKTFLIGVSNIIFYKYIFEISIQKSTFMSIIQMFLLMVLEIFQLFITTKILNISKQFYYAQYAGSILGNLVVCFLFIIITYCLKKILKKLINKKIENNTKITFFLVLTFICIGLFFYILIREFRIRDDIYIYITVIIVLILFLISMIKQTIDNTNLTREYDKLLEFMTTYENEIEKQRILRHEVKNEYRAIRAKICDKQDNKEIVEYIDEILKDKIKVNHEEYAKFGYLPANGIKGLCYFKVQEAEEKGIQVALNISKRIKQSTIYELDTKEQRDFGRILGVFLDNAIEASLNSNKKQLGIEAYINEEKEFRMIISNTYDNQINKEKIGKESFSTKGKGRGHGLLLVKRLTESSEIFETRTDIQEKIYVQTIMIKKK